MIEYANLPTSALAKLAELDASCLRLSELLEQARRALQDLRTEFRDCVPRTAYDQVSANEESDRVLGEWKRLEAAIMAQVAVCERLEGRLQAEQAVAASCKSFLHQLPAGANLKSVEGRPGDLDEIRERIKQAQAAIAQLQRQPVPSEDLAERIANYVDALSEQARPIISGIGAGGILQVSWPLTGHANRIQMSGFVPHEANALLMSALLFPERLAERLLDIALVGGLPAAERDRRLSELRSEEVQLRYDEEASVGQDAARSSSQPPWAVLMVAVEYEQQASAA